MIVYGICYVTSYILSRVGQYGLSGAALMLAAVWLYLRDYRRSGNLLHLRGLFSLSWVGGQGVACLRLSSLQTDWQLKTWICFFLAFAGFWCVFGLLSGLRGGEKAAAVPRRKRSASVRPLYYCILVLTAVSLTAFVGEAVYLGFIPLFLRGVPHAYSAFHVTGVHYLTVSCVLVPPMAVMFFLQGGSRRGWRNALVILACAVGFVIPILCVSRFQLIFAVTTALFTYVAYARKLRLGTVIALAAVMLPLYVVLTVARSHDVEYLNGIFEMKNASTPIFISQPYIYIANNYENFNCLVEALPAHTFGVRMLFPLWALTGLKFFFPYLMSFPIYIDKEELTTLTMFYDAYYDFGAVGVLAFSAILGAAAFWLSDRLERMRNPMGYVLYAQFAVYMALAFFTTWFSNPTTWFYFAVTGAAAFACYWAGE